MQLLKTVIRQKQRIVKRFQPFYCLYLIQGEASRVKKYFHLNNRKQADCIFLTYDEPLEGAIYFPNSTFATGRNRLIEEAKNIDKKYNYYIFLDDDVVFKKGNWSLFEKKLKKWQPAIGVPVVPKTQYSIIRLNGKPWELQCFLLNDEQFLAVRHDVFLDTRILPYITKFDHLSAWAACEIQQIMIQTIYQPYAVQFNEIEIDNVMTGRHDNTDRTYKTLVRDWLKEELGSNFIEPWYYWEDWRGIDSSLQLDIFIKYRNEYETNFEDKLQKIIANTYLFKKRDDEL